MTDLQAALFAALGCKGLCSAAPGDHVPGAAGLAAQHALRPAPPGQQATAASPWPVAAQNG